MGHSLTTLRTSMQLLIGWAGMGGAIILSHPAKNSYKILQDFGTILSNNLTIARFGKI